MLDDLSSCGQQHPPHLFIAFLLKSIILSKKGFFIFILANFIQVTQLLLLNTSIIVVSKY